MTTATAPDLYGSRHRSRYDLDVTKRVLMGIQELRLHLRERVNALQEGIHTVFTRHGKPVAVLVDIEWYRRAAEAVGEPTDL